MTNFSVGDRFRLHETTEVMICGVIQEVTAGHWQVVRNPETSQVELVRLQ